MSWEDDLIMTGVRSFDIKAYDNSLAGYADLGWGDDLRVPAGRSNAFIGAVSGTAPFLAGNADYSYLVTGGKSSSSGILSPAAPR